MSEINVATAVGLTWRLEELLQAEEAKVAQLAGVIQQRDQKIAALQAQVDQHEAARAEEATVGEAVAP